jgi:hypothetical protein
MHSFKSKIFSFNTSINANLDVEVNTRPASRVHLLVCPEAKHEHSVASSRRRYDTIIVAKGNTLFGPKRDEVTGEWRKLHNEELHDLYSSSTIVRVTKSRRIWAGHVARMGEGIGVYRGLVRKPEGKRPLGRPRRR